MVKKIMITVTVVLFNFYLIAQNRINNKIPFISINAGTFFATQTKIESAETAKLLENYTTPGVSFGISYILEQPHLFYSGSLAARILPSGHKILIRFKDRIRFTETTNAYDDLFRSSQYFFSILSIPVKIGYQTLENNSKQKFWINTGLETNFISPAGLSEGSINSVDVRTESFAKVYPSFILGGGVSKVHKNGDQLKFGLEFNVSNTNVVE